MTPYVIVTAVKTSTLTLILSVQRHSNPGTKDITETSQNHSHDSYDASAELTALEFPEFIQ
jgi:hypothetical protein